MLTKAVNKGKMKMHTQLLLYSSSSTPPHELFQCGAGSHSNAAGGNAFHYAAALLWNARLVLSSLQRGTCR